MSTTDLPALDVHRRLGDLVAEQPARARVLERLGIDYCCHGGRSLAEASAGAGLDPSAVAAELAAVDAVEGADHADDLAPVALVDHILATHHVYLHEELPLLHALATKVRDVHGGRHPELHEVARLVEALRGELEPHLAKEEQVLFPAIRRVADLPAGPERDQLLAPIRVMQREHEAAGELLADLRAATDGYQVPADGCASYRSLYDRLGALELDTFRHIHLENNVLFPAVLA